MSCQLIVSSVFHIPGQATVLAGQLTDGSVRIGQRVLLTSATATVERKILGIEDTAIGDLITLANEGQEIAVQVASVDFDELPGAVTHEANGTIVPAALSLSAAPKPWWQFW